MKKLFLILSFITISIILYGQLLQPNAYNFPKLKLIADNLNSITDYQSDCDFEFNSPIQGRFNSAAELIIKKNPQDTLCGFSYFFKTQEKYKDHDNDFIAFFNNAFYSARNGAINKYSLFEEPDKFKKTEFDNGFSPAIHRSSSYLHITPIELSKFINESLADIEVFIVHKPDTVIAGVYCDRYIIKKNNLPLASSTELCFDKILFCPVFYKFSSGGIDPQYLTLKLSNTKTDKLSENYFSEENLFGRKLGKNNKEIKNKQLKIGEVVPDWELPILGKTFKRSSKELRGKYILLEFTGTWCPHCWDAVKLMNRLEDEFGENKKLSILSIFSSEIDTPEKITSFAKKENIKSTILYSAKNVGEQYLVIGYPTFFIVDPEGKLLMIQPGYSKEIEVEIVEFLKDIINKI